MKAKSQETFPAAVLGDPAQDLVAVHLQEGPDGHGGEEKDESEEEEDEKAGRLKG